MQWLARIYCYTSTYFYLKFKKKNNILFKDVEFCDLVVTSTGTIITVQPDQNNLHVNKVIFHKRRYSMTGIYNISTSIPDWFRLTCSNTKKRCFSDFDIALIFGSYPLRIYCDQNEIPPPPTPVNLTQLRLG